MTQALLPDFRLEHLFSDLYLATVCPFIKGDFQYYFLYELFPVLHLITLSLFISLLAPNIL